MKYYKFLTFDNRGEYSNFDYTEYLPHGGEPGKWLPSIPDIKMCERGYHAFEVRNILTWTNSQLFEVEIGGATERDDKKVVSQEMRFVRKIDTWNDRTVRLFACWCARDALPIYEDKYPDDPRPRLAIETAERYANGLATAEELEAAQATAQAAAWAAAWDAAQATAQATAQAAAQVVAWDAAQVVAWDAAQADAWAAAWDARARYASHLLEMLGLEEEE